MKQESNIAITGKKQTDVAMNESNIKSYFCKLIELQKKDEPFPVDLDLVWPIAYTLKANCIRELKEKFIEGIDFQLFIKNDERSDKFRQRDEYRLSISCMEYLIVRKVRPVFDVYRKVFKAAVEQLSPVNEEITNYTSAVFDDTQPLNKQTPLRNIRGYFLYIKDLVDKGEKFPFNTDDVWELAYCAKRRVTDKLLGINKYNTSYVDGKDYLFVGKGVTQHADGRLRGTFYLSIPLFELLILPFCSRVKGIYSEVFARDVARHADTNTALAALPSKETSEASVIEKKSTIADAFQQLITVQTNLKSIKDRDSLQRVMLVLSDYNMLLSRLLPETETK